MRTGCGRPAVARLSYDTVTCRVWLDPVPERPGPTQEICELHAARLTVPRGWMLCDRRGAAPHAPALLVADDPLVRLPANARAGSGHPSHGGVPKAHQSDPVDRVDRTESKGSSAPSTAEPVAPTPAATEAEGASPPATVVTSRTARTTPIRFEPSVSDGVADAGPRHERRTEVEQVDPTEQADEARHAGAADATEAADAHDAVAGLDGQRGGHADGHDEDDDDLPESLRASSPLLSRAFRATGPQRSVLTQSLPDDGIRGA